MPPEIQKKLSQVANSNRVQETSTVKPLRDVRQPAQGTSADPGDVKL